MNEPHEAPSFALRLSDGEPRKYFYDLRLSVLWRVSWATRVSSEWSDPVGMSRPRTNTAPFIAIDPIRGRIGKFPVLVEKCLDFLSVE